MFQPFVPSADEILNWVFFLKLFGGIAGILFLAYVMLEHVVDPVVAYFSARSVPTAERQRELLNAVIQGRFQ